MKVRCKMQCVAADPDPNNPNGPHRVVFDAVYDPEIEQDRRFSKATPSGRMVIAVDNPEALRHLVAGRSYYLDLSPVAEGE